MRRRQSRTATDAHAVHLHAPIPITCHPVTHVTLTLKPTAVLASELAGSRVHPRDEESQERQGVKSGPSKPRSETQ